MNTHTQTTRAARRLSVLVTMLAFAGAAHAGSDSLRVALPATAMTQTASNGVEQRVSAELSAMLAELIATGAFGSQSGERIAFEVDTPARKVSDLGLLVDSTQSGSEGLRVLGVTPGGNAERIGLRAGDVVIALNGTSLAGTNSAALLRQTVDALPDDGMLAFDLLREGRTHTLSGALSRVYLPAMRLSVGERIQLAGTTDAGGSGTVSMSQGCGRISDFDVAPRQQQLHAAKIISIDGVAPGPSGSHSFRVDAGTHQVKVTEMIESRYLSFNDRARNAGLSSDRYKTLQVEVEPGMTTLIAARINVDRRNDAREGAYWDPVAWKQIAEACR